MSIAKKAYPVDSRPMDHANERPVVIRGLRASIHHDDNGNEYVELIVPYYPIEPALVNACKKMDLRESQIEEVCVLVNKLSTLNFLADHIE